MPSGERSPSIQQVHEVGRYAAQALLYYKGGMPSATTSLIKVHSESRPNGTVKTMSSRANAARRTETTLGSARHERSRVVCT